jgi:hypothetical protein
MLTFNTVSDESERGTFTPCYLGSAAIQRAFVRKKKRYTSPTRPYQARLLKQLLFVCGAKQPSAS